MSVLKTLLSAALLTVSAASFAQDDIQLGEPGYGGNGCPQGSASVTMGSDNKSLSIIFDQFIAEAGPGVGKTIDRKACNISIPITVPEGYSFSIIDVDYRGFVSLPHGAMARFSAEYFFATSRGPRFFKAFYGEQNTDYFFQNTLGLQAQVWSPCGAQFPMRVNANMMLQNRSYDDAMATVDTVDVGAGIVYQLQWKRCGEGPYYY